MPPDNTPATAGLGDALAEARAAARDQLAAAWQLHAERIQEQLHVGWPEHIERIFEERFSELAARIEEEFERQLSARLGPELEAGVAKARQELCDRLSQAARRIRQADSQEMWSRALLDGAAGFCRRTVLLAIAAQWLKVEGLRGFEVDETVNPIMGTETLLALAPAFANAAESMDTVVAMRTAGELSETLAALLGESAEEKVYLFPVVNRQKVVAVLYAEPGEQPVNISALELLSAVAGVALEAQTSVAASTRSSNLVALVQQIREQAHAMPASWSGLSREEQDLHLRAQRFARVQVAEMRLYKSQAVKAGRSGQNLYRELKDDIDSGRQAFRRQFIENCASMVDYLHLELVRTLANDDLSLLGPEYPGPLA